MEKKHPKIQKSRRIVWSLEEISGHAKSYTCSFCKKGFSTAQALGGHMNIHRKDRAKLRESSQENMLSLDIVKRTSSPDHDHSQVSEIMLESRGDKQLSLFVQTSGENEEGSLLLIHGSSSHEELDLELRLGPEPHH